MNKVLVFDMDGTIANFYGVEGWLEMIRAEDVTPYAECKPLYDMDTLNFMLNMLKGMGYRIVVNTWLAMGSSVEFEEITTKAKRDWLDRYNFPYDDFIATSYGVEKSLGTKNLGGVQWLFDDNANVRATWTNGFTVDATNNILATLSDLLLQ